MAVTLTPGFNMGEMPSFTSSGGIGEVMVFTTKCLSIGETTSLIGLIDAGNETVCITASFTIGETTSSTGLIDVGNETVCSTASFAIGETTSSTGLIGVGNETVCMTASFTIGETTSSTGLIGVGDETVCTTASFTIGEATSSTGLINMEEVIVSVENELLFRRTLFPTNSRGCGSNEGTKFLCRIALVDSFKGRATGKKVRASGTMTAGTLNILSDKSPKSDSRGSIRCACGICGGMNESPRNERIRRTPFGPKF